MKNTLRLILKKNAHSSCITATAGTRWAGIKKKTSFFNISNYEV